MTNITKAKHKKKVVLKFLLKKRKIYVRSYDKFRVDDLFNLQKYY